MPVKIEQKNPCEFLNRYAHKLVELSRPFCSLLRRHASAKLSLLLLLLLLFNRIQTNLILSSSDARNKSMLNGENDSINVSQTNYGVGFFPYTLLRDVSDFPVDLKSSGDIPLFWHQHKSGGTSMKQIFKCLRKIQTRRSNGNDDCSDQDSSLKVCHVPFGSEDFGSRVINVDASSISGIKRSIDLGLAERGNINGLLKDGSGFEEEFIVDTSRIYESLPMFSDQRRARLFSLFRHPVHRAISKYFYKKKATWERNYQPIFANMTLTDYANSKHCDNNWITRRLVNKMKGELSSSDISLAKEIIKTKTLVLLLDDIEAGVLRMRQYFGWHKEQLIDEQEFCLNQFIKEDPMNVNKEKEVIEYGGKEWNMVRDKNLIDLEIYSTALEVYNEQVQLFQQTG